MIYLVDIAHKLMKELSSSEPLLFQRDGCLYLVSERGFAELTYGLHTRPINIPEWKKDTEKQPPEILESEDILGEENIPKREQKYLKLLSPSEDYRSFSLDEMIQTAQELAKIPDDGKIRMVRQGSGYHSHKYGYADDGIDVWIDDARVMDRERYLQILRDEEEKLYQQIHLLSPKEEYDSEVYDRVPFPNCVVMTPRVLACFPRQGELSRDSISGQSRLSWTGRRRFRNNYGTTLEKTPVSYSQESPFGMTVYVNAADFQVQDSRQFMEEQGQVVVTLGNELSALSSAMVDLEQLCKPLNQHHNHVFKKSIQEEKQRKKRRAA